MHLLIGNELDEGICQEGNMLVKHVNLRSID